MVVRLVVSYVDMLWKQFLVVFGIVQRESQISDVGKKEIDVHEQFRILTADIIAHTAFGSSYEDGSLVFKLQQEQQLFLKKQRLMLMPGYR